MLIRNQIEAADLHIDFVPMADVLFNLLIFFLLATTFMQSEREMKIALPQTASSGPISATLREIIINIDADGRAIVAGKSIEPDALAALIKTAVESNPDQKVSIRGDRATAYENVARVLDICKGAGIQEPYLESVPTN